jgi:hypothetical protein
MAEIDDLERRAYQQRVAEIPVPESIRKERVEADNDMRARLETLEYSLQFDPFDKGAAVHAFNALVFSIAKWKGTP